MGRRSYLFLGACLATSLAGLHAASRAQEPAGQAAKGAKAPAQPAFTKDVAPVLAKFCVTCHGGKKPKAGLALDKFPTDDDARKQPAVWEKVAQNLRAGEMPPSGRPKPSAAETDRLIAW